MLEIINFRGIFMIFETIVKIFMITPYLGVRNLPDI